MFKLDLEKAEEPEIKLPASTGSSKKQENTRKTPAFLIMPKPLTVWITTNCGKFFKVVLEKTLESPLDNKEIKPVHPKGNQPWTFFGRTGAETPKFWPPDAKSWLIWKNPDVGKDWKREEKDMTEEEMFGWHHWLHGHECEHAPRVGDGQGSLVCCSPWGCEELDTTEWLNWTDVFLWKLKSIIKPFLYKVYFMMPKLISFIWQSSSQNFLTCDIRQWYVTYHFITGKNWVLWSPSQKLHEKLVLLYRKEVNLSTLEPSEQSE